MVERLCIEECQDRIWPIYSLWPCCIQGSSTKSAGSCQFEVDVDDLSWPLFNAAASWPGTGSETARVQYNHYFSDWPLLLKLLWLSSISWILLLNHLKLLATALGASACRIRRRRLVVTMLLAHCLLFIETSTMRTWPKAANWPNCYFLYGQLLQRQHLP